MDAQQIRQLKPMLTRYLKRFDDCFARKDTRAHLPVYVEGQLSELRRKSVEPIAKAAGVPVRTLAGVPQPASLGRGPGARPLAAHRGREHASPALGGHHRRDQLSPRRARRRRACNGSIAGTSARQDNCIVTVHLGYAADDFHCLLDGELFLPESWSQDRDALPRSRAFPTTWSTGRRWKIALELYDRAVGNGVRFAWLTFDEWYGGKPAFLRALRRPQASITWAKCPGVYAAGSIRREVTHRALSPSGVGAVARRRGIVGRQPAGPRRSRTTCWIAIRGCGTNVGSRGA